jgi:hypothetical protein
LHRIQDVTGFYEKPCELIGRNPAFRNLLAENQAGLYETLAVLDGRADAPEARPTAIEVYASIASSDFSRDVLAARLERLAVIELRASGGRISASRRVCCN